MRKLFFFVSVLVTSLTLSATEVAPERAIQVANSFVPSHVKAKKNAKGHTVNQTSEIVYTHYMPKSGKPAIYVVNTGDAFALVSADDVAHPILGYNYSKSWPTDGNLPPQVKSFLDDLAAQMEAASEHPQDAATAAEWSNPRKAPKHAKMDNLPDSVGPLLTTTWDQGQYYNAMCPEDENGPDGHVYTGCVATAMAQIINYWGQKGQIHTRGIHSYQSNYGELRVNYDSTSYDFAHMPNQLTASSTQQEKDAVAKLMYECGVALNMEYGASESGANNIEARAALINFFHFSSNLSLAEKAYYKETEWKKLLYANLAKGYPIYYGGTYLTSSLTSSHAFVCDGYKEANYFHFNFGWDGRYDGWFRHSAVLSYNTSQCAILGIVPDSTVNVILCQAKGKNCFLANEPFEYCDILGYNMYQTSSGISCSSTAVFVSENQQNPLLVEILNFNGREMRIYDGEGENVLLRRLIENDTCDITNIISSQGLINIQYQSSTANSAFQLAIGHPNMCLHVTNLDIKSEKIGEQCIVVADWNDNSNSSQWQIRYRRRDVPNATYTIHTTTNHPDTIDGIAIGYSYEFGIRAICDTGYQDLWTTLQNVVVDLPRWTDVITSRPEGYVEDQNGNVSISSAEGLAWLSVMVRGLHGQVSHSFAGKTILLTSNIDLGGYRWYPISRNGGFSGIFDGQNHTISNMYVREDNSSLGLFGGVRNGTLKNINLNNGRIVSLADYVGGLVGGISDGEISNCHSSVDVEGIGYIGGLCGQAIANGEGDHIVISDCSATGTVYGSGEPCGGLIGAVYGEVDVKNCYALGDVLIAPFSTFQWDLGRGGLIGSARQYANIANCYSAGNVYTNASFNHPLGKFVGDVEAWVNVQYAYALDSINTGMKLVGEKYLQCVISDTTQFHHVSGTNTLLKPIWVENELYTDLWQALNAWVTLQNDQNLHIWIVDPNTGFPSHGENFSISCSNPTALSVSNATSREDTVIRTKLEWEQIGDPIAWEVLYVTAGQDIDLGTIVQVDENPCILTNIPVGRALDFYVRAVCEAGYSQWSEPVTYIPDKLHWTDVVTCQPDGYVEDADGNVYIYSSEGLAWLSKMVMEMDRSQAEYAPIRYETNTIELRADIDLSAYRWTPIGTDSDHEFRCHAFRGNNHAISGLYCNDLKDYQGLFGCFYGVGTISNLTIKQCTVWGENKVGGLIGESADVEIINCMVNGNVYGIDEIGGIVGIHDRSTIANSSFIGNVSVRRDITKVSTWGGYTGGICGIADNDIITNCYVVSEIGTVEFRGLPRKIVLDDEENDEEEEEEEDDDFWNGIIVGTGGLTDEVTNCYYLEYPTLLPIAAANVMENNSSFTGSNYTWTLSEPPFVNNNYRTDLVDALNAWVDANNSEGLYRHWAPDTSNVNGGFPVFSNEPVEKYVIIFQNEDGTPLQIDTLEAGTIPTYIGATPQRLATAEYTYTFKGWAPEIVAVTGEAIYTAEFDSVVNQYTITFNNYDGTQLQFDQLTYGAMPAYNGETPQRLASAEYTYTFKGWSPEIVAVTGDAIYTAEFDSIVNQYTITFNNYDGTQLQSGKLDYGAMPAYTGETPQKPATDQYAYTFKGWLPEVVAVTGDATYTATYDSTKNSYTVTFVDWNEIVLKEDVVEYGSGATAPPDPTREGYTFTGWDKDFSNVTENMTVTATYSENVGTGVDGIYTVEPARKVIIDNQIFILRDDKIYTVTGQEVR